MTGVGADVSVAVGGGKIGAVVEVGEGTFGVVVGVACGWDVSTVSVDVTGERTTTLPFPPTTPAECDEHATASPLAAHRPTTKKTTTCREPAVEITPSARTLRRVAISV